jgi:Fe2+ or Zn2+ uptake regulation protein
VSTASCAPSPTTGSSKLNGRKAGRSSTGCADRQNIAITCCAGGAVGFTLATIEDDTADLVRRHRYTEVTHHFDLYGICPQCRTAAEAAVDGGAHRPERQ